MAETQVQTKVKTAAVRVAECAALLDVKAPGWAARVPVGEVNVADPAKSPLAFVIGPQWDEIITAASAIELGAFVRYTGEADEANRAWRRQIVVRRPARRCHV